MGVVTANTCYHTRHILGELDRLTGLLCVVFFVTSGVELEIRAFQPRFLRTGAVQPQFHAALARPRLISARR